MAIQKKYDDIFSCVVGKAFMDPSVRPSTPSAVKYRMRERAESECLPVNARVCFDSERTTPSSYGDESETSSNSEPDEEEITFVERNLSYVKCSCGKSLKDHSTLHRHIATKHTTMSGHCPECDVPEKILRNSLVCRVCNIYSEELEEHLRIHYQDRIGCGALMECRICCRTFQTVHEVLLHEQYSHDMQRNKTPTKFLCDYCKMEFTTKHLRDGHLVSHFDHIIGDVWERVEQMQSQFTDQRLVNQCPICFHVMGSRKSFKMHIIQKHLTKNPETFMDILNRPSFTDKFFFILQERKLTGANSASPPATLDLKEEI
ncbi:unnamed protein product [Cylicocyclus nassatus]|uniref:C2H2-type domain-containing protein n=1 Tax=Cylicocyclus nassatus TaxID=53992 RepID=A0AA36GQZ0_CYLNA|nr:unnamed protein product [Cylicocyclus nassatus]